MQSDPNDQIENHMVVDSLWTVPSVKDDYDEDYDTAIDIV